MSHPADPLGIALALREAMPTDGFFQGKSWRISPEPLRLGDDFARALERLGHHLATFQQACNRLYLLSAQGRQPAWIAELLDRGKPPWLIQAQRSRAFAPSTPRIIRPDLILTREGFIVTELDSVPGGIGLTAWLSGRLSRWHQGILGGPEGMLDGFASILPTGDVVISQEASDYCPEMLWLIETLNSRAGEGTPAEAAKNGAGGRGGPLRLLDDSPGQSWAPRIYRFFELHDLANVPCSTELLDLALRGHLEVTPPFKPALEEKLWFALFWLRPLLPYWQRALGSKTLHALQRVIPYTWLVDPQPLPPHAVFPQLEAHSWDEVARFSQTQRQLVLKVSGFSPLAWGARGVHLGSDMPGSQWQDALRAALEAWPASPYILQRYHQPRSLEHPFLDHHGIASLRGRARLCPYYFLGDQGRPTLGGVLATICPDDKKILHGMADAILTVVAT